MIIIWDVDISSRFLVDVLTVLSQIAFCHLVLDVEIALFLICRWSTSSTISIKYLRLLGIRYIRWRHQEWLHLIHGVLRWMLLIKRINSYQLWEVHINWSRVEWQKVWIIAWWNVEDRKWRLFTCGRCEILMRFVVWGSVHLPKTSNCRQTSQRREDGK